MLFKHRYVFDFLKSEPYKYLEDARVGDNSDHQNQLLVLGNSRYDLNNNK